MSLHQELTDAINSEIESHGEATALSPTSVAIAVQSRYTQGALNPHIQYASLEHLKHMARRVMAGRFEADGEENETHQGDMFSGHLQDRYPLPKVKGQEPIYKRRIDMTDAELMWNEDQLSKSARARVLHAKALKAWRESRQWPKAA